MTESNLRLWRKELGRELMERDSGELVSRFCMEIFLVRGPLGCVCSNAPRSYSHVAQNKWTRKGRKLYSLQMPKRELLVTNI